MCFETGSESILWWLDQVFDPGQRVIEVINDGDGVEMVIFGYLPIVTNNVIPLLKDVDVLL